VGPAKPSMEDVAEESFRLMTEDPLQFFFGMRISNGKTPMRRLIAAAQEENKEAPVVDLVDMLLVENDEGSAALNEYQLLDSEAHLDVAEVPLNEHCQVPFEVAEDIDRELFEFLEYAKEEPVPSADIRGLSKVELSPGVREIQTATLSSDSEVKSVALIGSDTHPALSHSPATTVKTLDKNTCTQCFKTFNRPADLRRHVNSIHTDAPRNFVCEICGDSFKQKWHLNSHLQGIHSGKKPYECPTCQFPFARKSDMSKHVRVVHEKATKRKIDPLVSAQ